MIQIGLLSLKHNYVVSILGQLWQDKKDRIKAAAQAARGAQPPGLSMPYLATQAAESMRPKPLATLAPMAFVASVELGSPKCRWARQSREP
jgi:hypothetical protein